MAAELGAWLRQQREARGWPRAEMARRLVQAGHNAGDTAMPSASSMLHNIHRWEREGGISERHKLHYCRVLGIPPASSAPETVNDSRSPQRSRQLRPSKFRAVLPQSHRSTWQR
jgi:transcriptional regulator with XRE-family HTH domain